MLASLNNPFGSLFGRQQLLTPGEYLKYGGIAVFFLLLIVLYVFEFDDFDRTLYVKGLVVRSLAAGAALGFFLGYAFRKSASDLTERVQIYVFFIVLSILFMPLFGSLSNRLLSFHSPRHVQVELAKEMPYYASLYGVLKDEKIEPTGYYVFFYYQEHLFRIKSKKQLFPGLQQGDTVSLRLKKGLWGYSFIQLE